MVGAFGRHINCQQADLLIFCSMRATKRKSEETFGAIEVSSESLNVFKWAWVQKHTHCSRSHTLYKIKNTDATVFLTCLCSIPPTPYKMSHFLRQNCFLHMWHELPRLHVGHKQINCADLLVLCVYCVSSTAALTRGVKPSCNTQLWFLAQCSLAFWIKALAQGCQSALLTVWWWIFDVLSYLQVILYPKCVLMMKCLPHVGLKGGFKVFVF